MTRPQLHDNGNTNSKRKRSPSALHEAGLRHFRSGRFGSAEERCRQALSIDPRHADSLYLLGSVHAANERWDSAIETIAEAIRSNPNNPDYFSSLGTLLRYQNRFEEALKSYNLALKLKPDFVDVWIGLGDLLKIQKRYDESLLTYDHALQLDVSCAEAAKKAGLLLLDLERNEEALARFERVQAISPDQADIVYHMGLCLARLNKLEEAVACYRKSIEIKPDFVQALNNLGLALINLKRPEESLSILDHALSILPGAELFDNKANALRELGRYDDALACYDRALALKPDFVLAYSNRGLCLDAMTKADEALSSYKAALALQPGHALAHWNLAVNRLRAGDLETGWVESEWRWKCPELRLAERKFGPIWLGAEPIAGKTLLLHNEQGLGDALQFCRYVPLLAARGARVILEIDPSLCEILSRLDGVSRVISRGEALPDFDFHCSLFSLPLAFKTTLDTIPSATPYLSAGDPTKAWEHQVSPAKSPRIGLVWSGNPNHQNDRNRSIALETLLPLLDVEAQFISLQKDLRPGDKAILSERSEVLDLGPELKSFADTAAVIEHLDLLISVDTSVAHLAGALGRPVWVLLPYVSDWRWLVNRTDSPWYPTARLFRQSETYEWHSVVHQTRVALQTFCKARADKGHEILT